MALFYSDKSVKKSPKSTARLRLTIQDLDYRGLGVAKHNGKTWFVENALPSEVVEAKIVEEKSRYGQAQAVNILQQSVNRQTPFCAQYAACGGCQMQHIPLAMQRETKQRALQQRLAVLQTEPIAYDPMLMGEGQGYRRRAKLSIALSSQRPVLGFRQAQSQQITPISQCEVLVPRLAALLSPLQTLLATWRQPAKLGHIELVEADNGVVLLLRHVGVLAEADSTSLRMFARQQNVMLFVMTDKQTIEAWCDEWPYYEVMGLKLRFSVRDFIQINAELNRQMVATAVSWLALDPQDRVLDLFCGMGNFTLPIALQAGQVVGVEGVEPMVEQARANAKANGVANVHFYQTDLSQPFADQPWAAEPFNKVLLDPARDGAWFCLDHLCDLAPERIVYVSCHSATLVRDAEQLISRGYRIEKAAMIDMFPHTGHLESVVCFRRVEVSRKRV